MEAPSDGLLSVPSALRSRLSRCHETLRDMPKDGCEGIYRVRFSVFFLTRLRRRKEEKYYNFTTQTNAIH